MLKREPVAIIGIGCRYPGGAHGPDAFWRLMKNGVDAVSEVPADRWNPAAHYDPTPGQRGKTITRWGGFLDAIDRFDAGFFGLSPREAAFMDPQQRLLLQTAWEAIDDGGVALDPAGGSPVGVFMGVSTHDYSQLQSSVHDLTTIDPYTATGTAMSIVANRISYCLNLRGPSVAVDTACSSSLVALHLACTSLWAGEVPVALAGGVNVIIGVSTFVSFSRSSMLSPDGRCKAFDARANGFARGEGAGVVALKPLRAAIADGNPIYAVIAATAVNQDGRTNGITVPSGEAQAALVREACRQAGVSPADIQYVEAHGTGTPVGDPIEARALGTALGEGRNGTPCLIGSVKTNIGHLEAGAGIAGLIKTALALQHGEVPPSLHFERPNPNIDFEGLKLRVARSAEKLRNGTAPITAGVNSFGFGGTNAHAILQSAPKEARRAAKPSKSRYSTAASDSSTPASLLVLSARHPEALRAVARDYRDLLLAGGDDSGPLSLGDVCFTAGEHRTHHGHRLAVVGDTPQTVVAKLDAFLQGETGPGLTWGEPVDDCAPVFVCSGQGPQWWAMGRELLRDEPVFRAKIHECDALLRELGPWSLLEELSRDEASSRLNETHIAQPAIFAIQVALAALWDSWGIRPAAVVGHSVGETAAAHIAGVLDLREAARVIYHRGACMEVASGLGRMLAASLSWDEAVEAIAPYADRVSIGALNGPRSVTLSGDGAALESIAAALTARAVSCQFLRVNYAFHSQQMEPVRDTLIGSLGNIVRGTAHVPLFSTVSGGEAAPEDFDAGYWWRNVRESVRFATAIDALIGRGHRRFLELSPHPVLGGSILECLRQRGEKGTVLASLRRKEPERATMLGALGALHVLGASVDWRTLHPSAGTVRLPAYPWQQERYWHEADDIRHARLAPAVHPLLANAVRTADPTWQTLLDLEVLPWLKDHRVQGRVVFPGAGYVEMALGAARALSGAAPCVIEDLDFLKALNVAERDEAPRLQLSHNLHDGGFTIASRSSGENASWTVHAAGRMRAAARSTPRPGRSLEACRESCDEEIPVEAFYELTREIGLGYGPAFRGVRQVWRGPREAVGRIELPDEAGADEPFVLHPSLLDACFQVLFAAMPRGHAGGRRTCYLPVQITRLRSFAHAGRAVWCHVRLTRVSERAIAGDITLYGADGQAIVQIEGFGAQAVTQLRGGSGDLSDALYAEAWKLQPLPDAKRPSHAALAPTADILRRMRRLVSELGNADKDRADLRQAEPASARLCGRYIVAAFRQMGWRFRRGERVTTDERMQALGVVRRHAMLFARYLGFLAEDGVLQAFGDGRWRVRRVPREEDLEVVWRGLLARFPRVHPELTLMRRCGRELAGVLQGRVDPLGLIFPDGSLAAAEHFYQDSDSFRNSNRLVGEAVAAALARLPEGRTVRILEIGAGTGGMTSYVLPRVPRDRTEYVFSDLSNLFFAKAEQKFFDHPFVRYELLDIDRSPEEQGFEAGSFDLVLASDAIHATRDLARTMKHVRSLLAPGGMLVLLEADRPPRWPDLVFGLTEGWWRFTDTELRVDYPLIAREKWLALFKRCGFAGAWAVSDQTDDVLSRQSVFLAREPEVVANAEPEVASSAATTTAVTWLLFADRGGIARRLVGHLAARGDRAVLVTPAGRFSRTSADAFCVCPESPDDMRRLLVEAVSAGAGAGTRVVHLWNLDADPDRPVAGETLGCHSVLHLAQALIQEGAPEAACFALVTRGAQAVETRDPVAVAQSAVWGLGRVIGSERPRLRPRLIDLSPTAAPDEELALLRELDAAVAGGTETEVARRGAARYVSRIVPTTLEKQSASPRRGAFRLEVPNPGALDRLVLRARPRRRPAAGEVEIEIKAAALNFRDVMKTLGIYPTEDDRDNQLGDECSGVITAVGRGVKHLKRGDEVVAIARGAFCSHLTTEAARVMRKPARFFFDEAATIPVAFLTAWYALHHLGRIRRGDRVLVQAATGGVGLAAIQIARLAGAEIFATAGNTEKREFLRALGIVHVMDSRSLSFADEVRELTGGRGVDLVLNSLAGEAIAKGIECLAPGGRFLEIGKRDIYQNSKLGLRALRHNVSLHIIDLAQIMQDEPERTGEILRRVLALMASGRLHPLPLRTFQVSQAVNAFRHMSQARHVGKIVLGMEHDHAVPVPVVDGPPLRFRRDGTYLVTGGLGGFGQAVAAWLLQNGAGHVVLASRRDAKSAEVREAVARLREQGGEVTAIRADVSRAADVSRLLRRIERSMPPLRGILHAAMVLDDGAVGQLDAERFRRVMAPKAHGAWHLHARTRAAGTSLDFFVLFSSVSALIGNPGQGNYAAANCQLQALARHRRALGLPALAVDWGAISEVGFVARNARVETLLRHVGLIGIKPADATAMLGTLLRIGATRMGVFPVDWRKWAASAPAVAIAPRYSEVVTDLGTEAVGDGSTAEALLALPAAEQLATVTTQLKGLIAKVLRTAPGKLDTQRPLNELGLDSLMSIELLERIEGHFGVTLPAGGVSAAMTIDRMAGNLLKLLGGCGATEAPNATPDAEAPAATADIDATCLVDLRAEGALAPLFCLHPAGGLVNIYEPLVKRLPAGRPVVGIQSRALDGLTPEHTSIETLAQTYARLIRSRQPRGPYHLAGFSVGGLLALAVAHVLEASGERVALLATFDTDIRLTDPVYVRERFAEKHIATMYGTLAREIPILRPLVDDELADVAARLSAVLRELPFATWSGAITRWLDEHGYIRSKSSSQLLGQYMDLFGAHGVLVEGFAPKTLRAPIRAWHADDDGLGASRWNELTRGAVNTGVIAGNHYDLMLPPQVDILAAELGRVLEEVGSR